MKALRICAIGLICGACIYLLLPAGRRAMIVPIPIGRTPASQPLAAFLMSKSLGDIRRTPLFDNGAGGDASESSEAPANTAQVTLVGVMRGSQHRALLSFGTDKPVWISEGQTTRGLTIVDVQSTSIRVRSGSGSLEVALFQPAASPAVPARAGPEDEGHAVAR